MPNDEAVERGVRRARVAPRPQQRAERDDDERTEIERREAEPRQDPGRRARRRAWPSERRSRPSSGAVVAELPFLVGEPSEREDEEAGLAEEFVGASGDNTRGGPIPPFIDIDLFVLELFFVVLECGTGRALLEEHVERLLDVVGVQLLVEVDDVVLLVVGGLGVAGSWWRCRR